MCLFVHTLEYLIFINRLGTSAEGAELRARMQSACLLSDMESFKVSSQAFHPLQTNEILHNSTYNEVRMVHCIN